MLLLLVALAALGTSMTRDHQAVSWRGSAGSGPAPTGPAAEAAAVAAPPTRDPVQATPGVGRTGAPGRPAAAAPAADAGAGAVVRYTFDTGLADVNGLLPLRMVSRGGRVTMMDRAGGKAVRFPPPCERYGADDCARVVLESGPAPFLNPGTGPVSFGATVLMSPKETTKGANVLQKGYSVGRSQFKLQVDGHAGRPSCVLVGVGSSRIFAVIADRTVADGQWHRVGCVRSGASLTVTIDDVLAGSVSLPTTLSVHNDDSLRIGGKGNSPNNDQFTGAVDDVYVIAGPQ
jgi:hypothetical protein